MLGNERSLRRRFVPTGEKQRTIFKCFLQFSMKYSQRSISDFIDIPRWDLIESRIISLSSGGNRFGTSPVFSILLTFSINTSSFISVQRRIKTTFFFSTPTCVSRFRKSSYHSPISYIFEVWILKILNSLTNADNLIRDCLPLPPIPITKALPFGDLITRVILVIC